MVYVTGRWAGVENVWEQKKLEVREMPENGDESHLSSSRFVRREASLRLGYNCNSSAGILFAILKMPFSRIVALILSTTFFREPHFVTSIVPFIDA
jgi:hypothetical protein